MGREIRKVPPNWKHPQRDKDRDTYARGGLQPMFDQNFDDRFSEWLADFDLLRANGLTENQRKYYPRGLADWLQDEGAPPDPSYYRAWRDDEATWFQVWETVSEGTPVTPPFETREELVDYLVEFGDFWQQKRWEGGDRFMQPEKPGYSREAAEKFVMGDGWAPSFVIIDDGHGTRSASGIDIPAALTRS